MCAWCVCECAMHIYLNEIQNLHYCCALKRPKRWITLHSSHENFVCGKITRHMGQEEIMHSLYMNNEWHGIICFMHVTWNSSSLHVWESSPRNFIASSLLPFGKSISGEFRSWLSIVEKLRRMPSLFSLPTLLLEVKPSNLASQSTTSLINHIL